MIKTEAGVHRQPPVTSMIRKSVKRFCEKIMLK